MKINIPLKCLPIPMCCNTPANALTAIVECDTELGLCTIHLYEHSGVFWFCLNRGDQHLNSVGFVSLRNCVSSLKDTSRSLGFVLRSPRELDSYVRRWERGLSA